MFGQISGLCFPRTGTPVAIKRLGEEAAAATRGGTAEEAWRTECSLLATTVHPNVVPVLGSSSDGPELLLVYGYMSEGSLEQRLTRSMPGRKPLSAVQRLPILSDVVRGLAHLHSIGIIHRDIKPANLLLDHGLKARIGDFGIARALESGAGSRPGGTRFAGTATGVRSAPGTLVYMAPEYLKGGAPTPRVDAFALGLACCVTGVGGEAASASPAWLCKGGGMAVQGRWPGVVPRWPGRITAAAFGTQACRARDTHGATGVTAQHGVRAGHPRRPGGLPQFARALS